MDKGGGWKQKLVREMIEVGVKIDPSNWEHLLHYCDMERRGKKEKSLNALYSVN